MVTALVWNLLLTGVLAVLLVLAGRVGVLNRRPALRHTLWLLLLAKLLTPPLIPVPLLPPAELAVAPIGRSLSAPSIELSPIPAPEVAERALDVPVATQFDLGPVDRGLERTASEPPSIRWWLAKSLYVLTTISLFGTFLLVTAHSLRAVRLGHWLRRFGAADPGLERLCGEVADELGIRSQVHGCVVDARTVPLLWGWRRATVVVPRKLMDYLDEEPLRSIVTHELAHYLRRDHWANLFALVAKAIFWWNPVTWLAHREIRAAQESCCDAIAIDRAHTTRQNYAATLLRALDFVQLDGGQAQSELALQMGSGKSVLRRFEMIGNAKLTYRLSRWSMLTLAVAMIPLLCLPVRSQEKEPPVKIAIDKSRSMDSGSAGDGNVDNAITGQSGAVKLVARGEVIEIAGSAKQLFVVGITRQGAAGKRMAEAWVLDRSTGKTMRLQEGSIFQIGKTRATIGTVDERSVSVGVGREVYGWNIGAPWSQSFGDTTEPELDEKPDKSKAPAKGELAGGGLSGPVQIELLADPEVMILRGDKEDIRRLKELIDKIILDIGKTEPADDDEKKQRILEVYQVAPLDPEQVLKTIRTLAGERKNFRMEIDRKSGRLLVLGTREEHDTIKAFLKTTVALSEGTKEGSTPNSSAKLRLQFRFQPWSDVLKWYAETAGLSLATDTSIPGTFNYADDRRYSISEALDLMNSVLVAKGFALIVRDRLLFVIDLEEGIPAGLVPRVKKEDLSKRGKFELVTVVFPLGDLEPEQTRKEFAALLGPHGQGAVLPQSKQIVVTDRAETVRAIAEILAAEDK